MAQENVDVVRQALAALDSRDVEAYLEFASPEIVLINPASALEGPSIGHEGIRGFFRGLTEYSSESSFRVEDIRAVGDDRVLAFFVLTALSRITGIETSVHSSGVYDLEDGKIRRAHIFADRSEALEAVGLSE
jgi:ketosteroid isomerase-like protein